MVKLEVWECTFAREGCHGGSEMRSLSDIEKGPHVLWAKKPYLLDSDWPKNK